jgi:uncharacterized membrane protein
MQDQTTHHDRTQFQVDRVSFFSDAVIAIAITLFVLEIKIPQLGKNIGFTQIFAQYGGAIWLHVLALFFGFFTIGNLWMRHHELFEHINNYNSTMVRVNLLFLLSVILLPISISFVCTPNEPQHISLCCYMANLFLCSFTFSLIVFVVFHKKHNFSGLSDKVQTQQIKLDSYAGTIAFFIAVVLIFCNISWFFLAFILVPAIKIMYRKKMKMNKAKSSINHH